MFTISYVSLIRKVTQMQNPKSAHLQIFQIYFQNFSIFFFKLSSAFQRNFFYISSKFSRTFVRWIVRMRFEGRWIRLRGRLKTGLKVDGFCKLWRATPFLLTGVSTVRIRIRWSLPVLVWWCSSVVLRHAGVSTRSSQDGASHHDWDHPGTGQ